jgi:hypothetical protein
MATSLCFFESALSFVEVGMACLLNRNRINQVGSRNAECCLTNGILAKNVGKEYVQVGEIGGFRILPKNRYNPRFRLILRFRKKSPVRLAS